MTDETTNRIPKGLYFIPPSCLVLWALAVLYALAKCAFEDIEYYFPSVTGAPNHKKEVK
jgi:hypothetical protein